MHLEVGVFELPKRVFFKSRRLQNFSKKTLEYKIRGQIVTRHNFFFWPKKKHDCVKFVTAFNDTNLERNPPLNGNLFEPRDENFANLRCTDMRNLRDVLKRGESRLVVVKFN